MMSENPYVAWKPFYSVGSRPIDAQHKQIIELINELFDVLERDQDGAEVEPLLDRLIEHTDAHFADEEQLMQEIDYEQFAEHKILHDELRQKTLDLRANIGLMPGADMPLLLRNWWIGHIQGRDKGYSPYLRIPVQSLPQGGPVGYSQRA